MSNQQGQHIQGQHIEIYGSIASGKTSIGVALETLGHTVYFDETQHHNPYRIEDIISDPINNINRQAWRFHRRASEIKQISTADGTVLDYSFISDYGAINFWYNKTDLITPEDRDDSHRITLDLINYYNKRLPSPKVYIKLECEPDTQWERLQDFGFPEERRFWNKERLQTLNEEMDAMFNAKSRNRPVIHIDTTNNDITDPDMVQTLLSQSGGTALLPA